MSDTNAKDLNPNGTELNNSYTGSNTTAPRPSRGFEPAIGKFANPTEARQIAGSGTQGFGRAGYGPDYSTGIDRGQFAARTKLTSKP